MKAYDKGMEKVAALFNEWGANKVPHPVLERLSKWVEEIMPHYLRTKRREIMLKDGEFIAALKKEKEKLHTTHVLAHQLQAIRKEHANGGSNSEQKTLFEMPQGSDDQSRKTRQPIVEMSNMSS